MTAPTISSADTLPPDPPCDFTLRIGDKVVYHAYFNDYDAEVVDIHQGTRLCPPRYHLHVEDELGVLTWVWCRRERIDIRLTRETVEGERE